MRTHSNDEKTCRRLPRVSFEQNQRSRLPPPEAAAWVGGLFRVLFYDGKPDSPGKMPCDRMRAGRSDPLQRGFCDPLCALVSARGRFAFVFSAI